jgi:PTH1 family peptidyl-tRNA hydrolase
MNMVEGNSSPYLIVGLGNPGKRHKRNRHNAGFMLLDYLAEEVEVQFLKSRGQALVAEKEIELQRTVLAKPQTYMNLSGNSIRQLQKLYQVPTQRLLVAFDELDLDLGVLRLRPSGGSSGHNGMRSIIQQLGTQDFARLRIGIGRPAKGIDPAEYVLQDFSNAELEYLSPTLQRGAVCVRHFLGRGIESAMNQCNPNSEK